MGLPDGSEAPRGCGTGSDCATAEASLTAKLQQIAVNDCSYCKLTKFITTSFYQTTAGQYQVQGYAEYYCKERVCEP
ncbi:MAG TPA: hypothetical protein VF756_15820 [Thermoanaerobaculia bacterium]